jgi:hypothetical protein
MTLPAVATIRSLEPSSSDDSSTAAHLAVLLKDSRYSAS